MLFLVVALVFACSCYFREIIPVLTEGGTKKLRIKFSHWSFVAGRQAKLRLDTVEKRSNRIINRRNMVSQFVFVTVTRLNFDTLDLKTSRNYVIDLGASEENEKWTQNTRTAIT